MNEDTNIANREVVDLTFVNYATKIPFLNLNYANVTSAEYTGDRVYATGGQGGSPRVGFDGKRAGTLKIETQITPMKLFSMLAGTDIATTATFLKREILTSSTKTITLNENPVVGSVYVYPVSDDCGQVCDITVTEKAITLGESESDGEYVCYYLVKKESGVQNVTFTADNFPHEFTVYGETPFKTESGKRIGMKLTYFKVHPQTSFGLSYSNNGDPSNLTITCDLYRDEQGRISDMTRVD